jgi:hypothetical protein
MSRSAPLARALLAILASAALLVSAGGAASASFPADPGPADATATMLVDPVDEDTGDAALVTAPESCVTDDTMTVDEPMPSGECESGELGSELGGGEVKLPPDATPHDPLATVEKGKEGTTADLKNPEVDGGRVTVQTGITFTNKGVKFEDGFSIDFKGDEKKLARTRWLQFISREIIAVDAKGAEKPLGIVMTHRSNHRYLTSDPTKDPNYVVDGIATPFYEDAGINSRSKDRTTIFDRPDNDPRAIQRAFNTFPGTVKVISRVKVTTYLVRDTTILYRVNIAMEWVYDKADATPRPTFTVTGDKADKLDDKMKAELLRRFAGSAAHLR